MQNLKNKTIKIKLCLHYNMKLNIHISDPTRSFVVSRDAGLPAETLFRWRHCEINHDLLLSKFLSGSSIIANFLFKQRPRFFKVGL